MFDLRTIFRESVPIQEVKTIKLVKTLLTGIGLIYLIFVLLEPFNFNIDDKYSKYSVLIVFSFSYFIILFVAIKWILPLTNRLANIKEFYFYHFILGYLFLIILVALTHHVLQNFLNGDPLFSLKLFLKTFYHAIIIGLIPTVILSLVSYVKSLQRQIKSSARDLTESLQKTTQKGHVIITSANNKDIYRFEAASILYIKSEDNYVAVVFRSEKTSNIKNELIRTTLKSVENQMLYPFLRVHRSFLVNLNYVHKISGNSQGMQLFIKANNISIPVSRSYIKDIRKAIKSS